MTTETAISYDELPLWMRHAKQEFDWGILIIIAMSLAIGWTFLINGELPAGTALEHYVFQASDILTGFEEGVFYPRWSPYAIKGYGAPIPNYYPMGTGYTISVISALFTNDVIQATRFVFVLAYVMAGLGVYLYLSRRTDSAIGLLGSVLYLYSPMIGSTIPYSMGDLSLLLASGLLPLTLWTSYRLANSYQIIDLILHAIVLGLLIWTHPQMALLSFILTIMLNTIEQNDSTRIKRLVRLLFGNLLGLALVTFYWMPAIFERDLVNWYPPTQFTKPMLTLEQFFAPITQIDSGLLIPQPQFKAGWLLLGFTAIGLIVLLRSKNLKLIDYLPMILCGAILVGLGIAIVPGDTWLIAPITLCMAIIGAHTLHLRQYLSPVRRRLLLTFSIATTVIFSQPVWLIPPPNLIINDVDATAQIRFEQLGYGIPTLPDGTPLPSVINPNIAVNRALVNSYTLDAPLRYNEQQNNANTILSLLSTTSHQQTYRIFNQFPTQLEFILPYFDGWQAYINGDAIPTYANPINQQLMIDVPIVANGDLVIRLQGTPIRNLAWTVSAVAVLTLIILGFIRSRNIQSNLPISLIETLPRTDIRLLLVMFITLGISIIIVTADNPIIQLQSPPTFSFSQSLPLQRRTGAGFEASTFTIDKTQAKAGDDIAFTIYWQALTDMTANYQSRVLLESVDNGLIVYSSDFQPMGTVPTRRWVRNKFVADQHTIVIPDNIIAGDYQILVEVLPCQTTCNLNNPVIFFDLNGTPIGRQLIIPLSITIR